MNSKSAVYRSTRSRTAKDAAPKTLSDLEKELAEEKQKERFPNGKSWREFEKYVERSVGEAVGKSNMQEQRTQVSRKDATKKFRPDIFVPASPTTYSAILDAKRYVSDYVGKPEVDQVFDYAEEKDAQKMILVLSMGSKMSKVTRSYAAERGVSVLVESDTLVDDLKDLLLLPTPTGHKHEIEEELIVSKPSKKADMLLLELDDLIRTSKHKKGSAKKQVETVVLKDERVPRDTTEIKYVPQGKIENKTWINGYTKKNGTVVKGHYRSKKKK